MIQAKLDYGSILYGDAAKTHLDKIDRVQIKALRCCLGALKSTPTNALLVEACEPPLHLRRRVLSDRYIIDRLLIPDHPVLKSLAQLKPKVLTEPYWNTKKTPQLIMSFIDFSATENQLPDRPRVPPLYDLPYGTTSQPNINKQTNFFDIDTDISRTATNTILEQKIQNNFPNFYRLFTDGSKTDQGVGCAVYNYQIGTHKTYQLHHYLSIFTAKMLAIYFGLIYIKIIYICTQNKLLYAQTARAHYRN
jgi:hypothetical protein